MPIGMIRIGLVLVLMIEFSRAVREFGFLKEHDGSLFELDSPIQKITFAGKLCFQDGPSYSIFNIRLF